MVQLPNKQSDDTKEFAEQDIELSPSSARPAERQKASKKLKNTLKTTAKILFAVALIGWMIQKGALDFNAFVSLASPGLVLFCIACVFGQIFINNFRWLSLMQGQGFESSIRHTLPLSLIGMFFNFAMPGGVGGDVVKGYYLLQDFPQKKFAGAVSIFMDRMMGFFIMIATAFFALFFHWSTVTQSAELSSIALGVASLFLGFLFFYGMSLSRRFQRLLQNSWVGRFLFEKLPGGNKFHTLNEALHSYRKAPSALAIAALMSLFNQILTVAFVYVIAQAMGITELPVSAFFFLVPVGMVVQALPISPAGIGVGQAAFFFLFNLYLGEESQLGPTAITIMQLTNLFWGLFGAYFFFQRKKPVLEAQQS